MVRILEFNSIPSSCHAKFSMTSRMLNVVVFNPFNSISPPQKIIIRTTFPLDLYAQQMAAQKPINVFQGET